MKKNVVKVLMAVMIIGTVIGAGDIRVKAETDCGDYIIYQEWENDLADQRLREAAEAEGYTYYSSDAEKAKLNKTPQENKTPSTTPSTNKNTEKTKTKPCEHVYDEEIVNDATCAEEGIIKYTCQKCKDSYTEPIAKLTEHIYESSISKEADCKEEGERLYTCSVCGDSYTEVIPREEHVYETEITVNPSCTVKGEEKTACVNCGDSEVKELEATGHTEGEWTVSRQASLFKGGEQIKTCTVCGDILSTEQIPSKYPVTYMYIAIGAGALLLFIVVLIAVISTKRKRF